MGLFDKLSDAAEMLKAAARAKEMLSGLEETLGGLRATGEAGAGMVRVTATGTLSIEKVEIDPMIVNPGEAEVLSELVRAAASQALERARELARREMAALAPGVPLPPGFGGG